MKRLWTGLLRLVALLILSGLALQLYFLARVALMTVVAPQSTAFQRSEIWRLAREQHRIAWAQDWRPYAQLSRHIKHAVVASEDANFIEHDGVEWDAIEKAWERNQRAQALAERVNEQLRQRQARAAERAGKRGRPAPEQAQPRLREAKLRGGSTITQQLAKNLFLSSEQNLLRKGQEFIITFMLESLLKKQRIFEIYLNNVEWGEGIFGAQAAARYYFGVDAAQLGSLQAARLAVMLPAPKRFEKRPTSPYVMERAGTVAARMGAVDVP
ncbi:MAG TPA: transglycosylase domain-containing protein [Burkholderiaceae bacterium]|nr:transglycosylase domain-containing protein [Burkholderiaceae bacterium]